MSMIKILQDGRVTIPKHIRDTLGLKQGDVAEAELENGRIVITPNFSKKEVSKLQPKQAKISALNELRRVMKNVHEKNRGVNEAEVAADVQRAVTELRQEEYAKKTSRCS